MLKKTLLLSTFVILVCMISACNNQKKDDTSIYESINIEDTEPATEYVPTTETGFDTPVLISYGILKELPIETDNYGNQMAYFMGVNGSDFIAIINPSTAVPENLILDEQYEVHHSELEIRSFPGQYPEVYKIQKSMVVEPNAKTNK